MEVNKEGKIWVLAGIQLPSPLKPIKIKANQLGEKDEDEEQLELQQLTPQEENFMLSKGLVCPPTPRKPRTTRKCSFAELEFFNVPELETVFTRRVKRIKMIMK
ncbi:cyclin-dependent kinase inhibitor [Rhynchospora pubera]|uniref:Cyclin-dependent kinase inhibitor n=1 Tax=Rhynchospora pubera TaxID=906938 RepID=A0AAV8CSH2_9POAL|nr:cyclin-dependent kinase inhibitor [Rhynchospora pubera]